MYVFDTDTPLSLEKLSKVARDHIPVKLSPSVIDRVNLSRVKLEEFVAANRVIYGVNTSMGGFVNWLVSTEKAENLQMNLINAVATNVGSYLDFTSVRAIMLARITSLSRGNSGISLENLDKYIAVYNTGIVPCVPQKGSLGTSGDLGPLASIALCCVGQWRVFYRNKEMLAAEALRIAGIEPMRLSYKEGLALINGTSGMVGLATLAVDATKRLLDLYVDISALSIETLHGKLKPFDPRVHRLKPHRGQQKIAEAIFNILTQSHMVVDEKLIENELASQLEGEVCASEHHIEDAYSIRCTPQILGPIYDALSYISQTVENELNSSNDNPLIVPEEKDIFHNGHFHGQYVAMVMDHLNIALTTMINISNSRIDRFLDCSHSNGLPPFLCSVDPGLRLGLMGGQFMTASVTAETRTLCTPISIQSLTSTADFQDIVSFGFVAARRAHEVLENTAYVVAFELLCACQAAEIRGVSQLSPITRQLFQRVRSVVPFLKYDEILTDYLETLCREVILL